MHCRETEEGDLWYYSTQARLNEVMDMLDPADLEEELCAALRDVESELHRHMSITATLTTEAKASRKSCLDMEDGKLTCLSYCTLLCIDFSCKQRS